MSDTNSTTRTAQTSARHEAMVGEEFGRWAVLSYAHQDKHFRDIYLCRCSCGKEKLTAGGLLRSGRSKSCGCLHRERLTARITRHGKSHTREYQVWSTMKTRCNAPGSAKYYMYGARGIKVCQRWENSFSAFSEDMGPRPTPQHSIDRIDNSCGYSPDNCRWATNSQQQRNMRSNNNVSFEGRTMCLKDWAKETGLDYGTIRGRLRLGWSVRQALLSLPRQKITDEGYA